MEETQWHNRLIVCWFLLRNYSVVWKNSLIFVLFMFSPQSSIQPNLLVWRQFSRKSKVCLIVSSAHGCWRTLPWRKSVTSCLTNKVGMTVAQETLLKFGSRPKTAKVWPMMYLAQARRFEGENTCRRNRPELSATLDTLSLHKSKKSRFSSEPMGLTSWFLTMAKAPSLQPQRSKCPFRFGNHDLTFKTSSLEWTPKIKNKNFKDTRGRKNCSDLTF